MAEYINKYANSAAIQSAVDGGELIKPYVALDESTGLIDWNSKKADYSKMPLTFEITGDGDIYWKASNTSVIKTIEYKLNDGEWTEITSTTGGTLVGSVVAGDVVRFRGNNAQYGSRLDAIYNTFRGSTAQFNVKCNIMSLIDSTNFGTLTTLQSSYTFQHLFESCTGLTDASNLILPATTLAEGCYNSMFNGCRSLTTAPELPATTLTESCYSHMFQNCSSLTSAPELPATTLTNFCYYTMFEGCRSLTTAPELPATTLAEGCYASMFWNCTSLTTAPELPATTLAESCYYWMFQNCSNLNYIKCLATDISATNCTLSWVQWLASTGTFVTPSSTNWSSKTGTSGIPEGWTRVDA